MPGRMETIATTLGLLPHDFYALVVLAMGMALSIMGHEREANMVLGGGLVVLRSGK